ncbi:TonB-dependent receptor [Teredinibacter haidensis]|uniref:TonB-dependent receptor n=1 Tax=Teredinibacter haidensis TaxID=2731755 RepID=UPI0009491453|nr:TonB-dependent receptor [Teredinibacter haidensis]
MFKKNNLSNAIAGILAASVVASPALAQEGNIEEVYVTGIRASMEASMDIKRESAGVVDAINAEDIGKFPDTNLAESLQRITGVSIDRVNGEGSEVTVRGFGGGNNLVVLNGRQIPSANVATVGGDQNSDFAAGSGRSFDFSNLASEGVSGLEVYKTGRASVSSGGIGATINVKTLKPLDNPGFKASVGGKIVNDTSVEYTGDEYTPELSGLVSWTDDDETFGVSLFASHQVRHSATPSATVNGWNISSLEQFLDPNSGMVDADTNVANAPGNQNQWVSVPNDSRWHVAETERERTNGMVTLQFRPMESLTLTADAFIAKNGLNEWRSDQTNWFNRPFDNVQFDSNPAVATTVFLQEDISGVKDTGFEQQARSTEDSIKSFGFNAGWQVTDTLNLALDVHSSEAESTPTGAFGTSSILVSMGAPVVTSHSLDLRRNGFPIQNITIDDSGASGRGDFGGTNNNGILDVGDLGSQVARTIASGQTTSIDQFNLDGSLEFDFGTFDFGVDYRSLEMNQTRIQTQQTLGNWGIENPGDIPADLIETVCLSCAFSDIDTYATGHSLTAFRGDAGELYAALSPFYASRGNAVTENGNENNTVQEDSTALYVQFNHDGEIAGMTYNVLAGVRWETTDVTSSAQLVPSAEIIWQSDNDFTITTADIVEPLRQEGSYDNVLPSIDFSLDVSDDIKARASYSWTIGRPDYGYLFVTDDADTPPRPTALGGLATGSSGNPSLQPLESKNWDLSFEHYYSDSSYASVGYYYKTIDNYVGTGVENRSLFGLRDPSSGQDGTRSGAALDELDALGMTRSDVNMFTMTALLDNFPRDEAVARFNAGVDPDTGALPQSFVDEILAAYDIEPNSTDPLFSFAVQVPVNTSKAHIDGMEFAWQHFFGDSGFGVQANYTIVNGDIGIDVASDPDENQFALLGLSDSANASLIFENDLMSARLAYNWRDDFLTESNRGAARNPVFVDEYRQLDMNVSVFVTDNLSVTFEAINLTGENSKNYARDESNIYYMQDLQTRYVLGARYTF